MHCTQRLWPYSFDVLPRLRLDSVIAYPVKRRAVVGRNLVSTLFCNDMKCGWMCRQTWVRVTDTRFACVCHALHVQHGAARVPTV